MIAAVKRQIIQACFRSFIQQVHPDKFVSRCQETASQNSKVIQIVNVLYGELLAQFENSSLDKFPVTINRSELFNNVSLLLPPTSWFIYASILESVKQLDLVNVSLSFSKEELSTKENFSIDALLSICQNVFKVSKVEDSLLKQLSDVANHKTEILAPTRKKICLENHKFADIFNDFCNKEDLQLCQTRLGKIARSPDSVSILSQDQFIRKGNNIKPKNLPASNLQQQLVCKKPTSFVEYQHQCKLAYYNIERFFTTN